MGLTYKVCGVILTCSLIVLCINMWVLPIVWGAKHCWAIGKIHIFSPFFPGFGFGVPIYWALGKGD